MKEQITVRFANPRDMQGELRSSIKRANIQGVQTAVEGTQRIKEPLEGVVATSAHTVLTKG